MRAASLDRIIKRINATLAWKATLSDGCIVIVETNAARRKKWMQEHIEKYENIKVSARTFKGTLYGNQFRDLSKLFGVVVVCEGLRWKNTKKIVTKRDAEREAILSTVLGLGSGFVASLYYGSHHRTINQAVAQCICVQMAQKATLHEREIHEHTVCTKEIEDIVSHVYDIRNGERMDSF